MKHPSLAQYPLVLPDYQLLQVLHESDNAIIVLAQAPDSQQVVIKRFKFNASQLEKHLLDEFLMESWALGLLDHRGLVRPINAGLVAGALYMIMEYVPGKTLRRQLSLMPHPSLKQALQWFTEITLALGEIHSIGLLHQDLKTSNILVRNDDSLALLDFGLETRLLVATGFMREDEIYCTPYYISPERMMGDPPDERTDLYALGVILYELLVGHKPYESPSLSELLKKHALTPIPKLPTRQYAYQPLINGLLAKFPENRLQSTESVVRLLQEINKDIPTQHEW
ncbi:serine/threonine-protein kinase [Thiothrix lacustris]|uniref:non-specific serine/threonine protein kinase n=1 Tax=Thiothrix lacustris TaxID=525917 RepID=A0ABY9MS07_9GAMM|nr:serine/threonine-protein kinase [Thiothrix lacustris]WML91435.1 serine/threonine-protein kinase [Thiothrix lacustris]